MSPQSLKRSPGRPLRGESRRRVVSFTIDPRHEAWLRLRAKKTGHTLSEVLDYVVDTAINSEQIAATSLNNSDLLAKILIPNIKNLLSKLCLNFGIQKLSLFGSIIRSDFTPESDIDILIEFNEKTTVGLFQLAEIELKLRDIFHGRKIDLRTVSDLSRYFREKVVSEAKTLVEVAN